MRQKETREFHGKIKDFESKEEQKFETAHLKAYKRGQTFFKFGKNSDKSPAYHQVKYFYGVKES